MANKNVLTIGVHHHFKNICWIFLFVLFRNKVFHRPDWTPAKYGAKDDLNIIYLLFIFERERELLIEP